MEREVVRLPWAPLRAGEGLAAAGGGSGQRAHRRMVGSQDSAPNGGGCSGWQAVANQMCLRSGWAAGCVPSAAAQRRAPGVHCRVRSGRLRAAGCRLGAVAQDRGRAGRGGAGLVESTARHGTRWRDRREALRSGCPGGYRGCATREVRIRRIQFSAG